MIKNYNRFSLGERLYKIILEANLEYMDDFRDFLKRLKSPIAKFLLKSEGEELDIKLSSIGKTDKADMVSFIQAGKKQEIKVGRLVGQILKKLGKEYTDKAIETFVNEFKAMSEISKSGLSMFRIVEGEEIKTWYNGEKYSSNRISTLQQSCMKYSECQEYFGIYVQNPEVCQLLILLNDDDELEGRALVWKLDNGNTFMDRIYYSTDSQIQMFKEYAVSEGWWYKKDQSSSEDAYIIAGDKEILTTKEPLTVNLKVYDFKDYPYMDTLKTVDIGSSTLSTNPIGKDTYYLESTEGGRGECDRCYGEHEIECPRCNGGGEQECDECDGNGKITCSTCDGNATVDCKKCKGEGKVEGLFGNEKECSACDGKGEVDCKNCDGEGDIDCDECNGGSINCNRCDGDGTITCPSCNN